MEKVLMIDDDHFKMGSHKEAIKERLGIDIVTIFPGSFGDGTDYTDYYVVLIDYEMSPDGPAVASIIREINPEAIIVGNSMLWNNDSRADELTDYLARDKNELVSVIKKITELDKSVINTEIPEDFDPRYSVVSCLCEYNGEILVLLRQDGSVEDNKWGVPAGKCDLGELPPNAIERELKEETKITIPLKDFVYWGVVYVRYPDFDFIYYIFRVKLDSQPKVEINPRESKEWRWVTPQEALKMDLVLGQDTCIKLVYGI